MCREETGEGGRRKSRECIFGGEGWKDGKDGKEKGRGAKLR